MKRKILVIGMIMLLGLTSGCGNNNATTGDNSTTSDKDTNTESSENTSNKGKVIDEKDLDYTIENGEVTINSYLKSGKTRAVIIPDTIEGNPVTIIGAYAFANDEKLEEVTLPDTVYKLEHSAFSNDKNITIINGLSNITEFGQTCLLGTSIASIELSENVICIKKAGITTYPDADIDIGTDINFQKLETLETYSLCATSLVNVELPGAIETIPINCLGYSNNLKTVTLNEGTVTIEEGVFYDCPVLEKVVIPASVTTIDEDAFDSETTATIYAPAGSYAETYAREHGIKFQAQ